MTRDQYLQDFWQFGCYRYCQLQCRVNKVQFQVSQIYYNFFVKNQTGEFSKKIWSIQTQIILFDNTISVLFSNFV